jgi:TatD DNase family protein
MIDYPAMSYVDVHTHLTHERFQDDLDSVIERARKAGVTHMVVNGLEPVSNRAVLTLAGRYPEVKPALGIYPVNAVCDRLPDSLPFEVPKFDVEAEIGFIREQAVAGALTAIGECGLDGHWVDESTFPRQEQVFEAFIEIAMDTDLPLILHTRRLEQRSIDILRHYRPVKVDLHCFGGKTRLAQEVAEKDGWWFSIPANARSNTAFSRMLRMLPPERILTETDAPYLGPVRGERNEPANVVGTIECLAEQRGWTVDAAREQVWNNYQELFS